MDHVCMTHSTFEDLHIYRFRLSTSFLGPPLGLPNLIPASYLVLDTPSLYILDSTDKASS